MKFHRAFALSAGITVLVALPLAAQWSATEKLDLDAIYRIKEEGLQRSKVMEIESYLTDVYGPRLTGSPASSTSISKRGRSAAAGRTSGLRHLRSRRARIR